MLTYKSICAFVVGENDEDADYDNVRGRLNTAANTDSVGVVTDTDVGSAVHSGQPGLTANETTSSGMTKPSDHTKVKKEKKFSWGQKKKKKPRTAAGI